MAARQCQAEMKAEMIRLEDEKLVLQGKVAALHEVIDNFARELAGYRSVGSRV